jgi:hypothetical protein
MILSSWIPDELRYQYWESEMAPERPDLTRAMVAIGEALPPLPDGSKPLGRGRRAVGTIVENQPDITSGRGGGALVVGALFAGWLLLRKKR